MHEANFTSEIVHTILSELEKVPAGKPKFVKVVVGEMLHLVPVSVGMHFDSLVRGTRLEGTTLELQEAPVRIQCGACGREGGVEDHHLLMCDSCGSLEVKLLSGNEIWIDSIQLET